MNTRLVVAGLFLLGLIAAVSAAVLTASWRAAPTVAAGEGQVVVRDVEVLVASRDLPAFEPLDSSCFDRMTVPETEKPENAIQSPVRVIGQVLVTPMRQGEAFTTDRFASGDSGVILGATLPEGYRATTIMLSGDTGIEEVLYPGCLVDVIASFSIPAIDDEAGRGSETVSKTLLESVQVLAVGGRSVVGGEAGGSTDAARRRGRVITLMLDNRQAETLHLASVQGNLTVVLRNPIDPTRTAEPGTRMSDLVADMRARYWFMADELLKARMAALEPEPKPQPAYEPKPEPAAVAAEPESTPLWNITVHRGREKEDQRFDGSEESLAGGGK